MTLTLAIIGTVLGALSFGWQAWTWFASGPVVVVTATNSLPTYGPRNEPGEWHLTVEASNKGRSATTVTTWGIEIAPGSSIFQTSPVNWSTPLPHRLEPGTKASLHMLADEVRNVSAVRGIPFSRMRPWVEHGGGKKVYGKGVPLTD